MKFKIFFLIFIVAILALAYLGYPIIKSRYFSAEKKSISLNSENQTANSNQNSAETNGVTFNSESLKITVSPSDCNNECINFKKEEELKYCQSICGLSVQTAPETSDNCEKETGIQKDYCLKDLGISKMDFKICEQIQDSGIKKTCKNRVTEDIIENQTKSDN